MLEKLGLATSLGILVLAAACGGTGEVAGQVVFTTDRDGNNEIYKSNADGTNASRLTENMANDASPSWSPDGSRIAFASDRDGNFEVYVILAS